MQAVGAIGMRGGGAAKDRRVRGGAGRNAPPTNESARPWTGRSRHLRRRGRRPDRLRKRDRVSRALGCRIPGSDPSTGRDLSGPSFTGRWRALAAERSSSSQAALQARSLQGLFPAGSLRLSTCKRLWAKECCDTTPFLSAPGPHADAPPEAQSAHFVTGASGGLQGFRNQMGIKRL